METLRQINLAAWILTIVLAVCFVGCDRVDWPQENNYVGGMEADLYSPPGWTGPIDCLDFFVHDGYETSTKVGRYVSGIGYIYEIDLKDTLGHDYTRGGGAVLVEVAVTDRISPNPMWDIQEVWEKNSPSGSKYGFMRFWNGTNWSTETGHNNLNAYTFNSSSGVKVRLAVGIGDPESVYSQGNTAYNSNYKLPGPGGNYNDCFWERIVLKLTINKPNFASAVERYVFLDFIRLANTWLFEYTDSSRTTMSQNCIFYQSRQYIGQPENYINTLNNSLESIEFQNPDFLTQPKVNATDKAWNSKIHKNQDKIIESGLKESGLQDLSSEPNLLSSDLYQLMPWLNPETGYYEWAYFIIEPDEKVGVSWVIDSNNLEQITKMCDYSSPFVSVSTIKLPQPFLGEISNIGTQSTYVNVVDPNHRLMSGIRLEQTVIEISPDLTEITLMSEWFISVENPELHGQRVLDSWGNPYLLIYTPSQTTLSLGMPSVFGDFDFNGEIGLPDLAEFAPDWTSLIGDSDKKYDAIYDGDFNGNIGLSDFAKISQNWNRVYDVTDPNI